MAKKIISIVFSILCIGVITWGGLSYIDIVSHNNPAQADYLDYANWNLFEWIF